MGLNYGANGSAAPMLKCKTLSAVTEWQSGKEGTEMCLFWQKSPVSQHLTRDQDGVKKTNRGQFTRHLLLPPLRFLWYKTGLNKSLFILNKYA